MKIQEAVIHNFRSVTKARIEAHDYLMLVGANNSGKSNIINALRAFMMISNGQMTIFPKREQLQVMHGLNSLSLFQMMNGMAWRTNTKLKVAQKGNWS